METSESGYRRPHGGHRQGRLQTQGSIFYAPLAKRPRKNPLVLSEAVSQIRRVNVLLLIDRLILQKFVRRPRDVYESSEDNLFRWNAARFHLRGLGAGLMPRSANKSSTSRKLNVKR